MVVPDKAGEIVKFKLTSVNSHGKASRILRIMVADKLALNTHVVFFLGM